MEGLDFDTLLTAKISKKIVADEVKKIENLINTERKLEKGTEKDDEKAPKNEKDEPKEIVKENWLLKLQRDIKNKKKLITPQKVTPSRKRLVKTPAAHGRSVREMIMSLEKKKK